jgi:hypothetical protein
MTPTILVPSVGRVGRASRRSASTAIRTTSFSETVGAGTGIRSRLIAGEFQNRFVAQGAGEQEARAVAEALASAYTKREKKGKKDKASAGDDEGAAEGARTSVLVYLSPEEIDLLSERVLSNWDGILQEVKRGETPALQQVVEKLIKRQRAAPAPDIAVWPDAGRPTRNQRGRRLPGGARHLDTESQWTSTFTAVDDLRQRWARAGMMGVTGLAPPFTATRLVWGRDELHGQTDTATCGGNFLRAVEEACRRQAEQLRGAQSA